MSNQEIISEMITFIDEKERQLQANKLLSDQQAKNDTVKAILDKLEGLTHENQQN